MRNVAFQGLAMTEILMDRQDTVRQTRADSTQHSSTTRSSVEVAAGDSIQANAKDWAQLCDELQTPPFYRPEWIRTFIESF